MRVPIRYANNKSMKQHFTALYQKRGKWFLGWIEEIPGVNTQGRTMAEAKTNLKEALSLVLETNRFLNKTTSGRVVRELIAIPS